MTIELKPEHQRVIDRAIHSGAFHDPEEVIGAALELLAEDIEDVAVSKTREHEPRVTLEQVKAELRAHGFAIIAAERVIDTLALARRRYPGAGNSLDALCQRYGIDLSRRSKHGALLDAEILAEVYAELLGGRQTTFSLDPAAM